MADAFRNVEVFRARVDETNRDADRVAVEEPLEVRLEGEPFSVIMRTPGADADLVAGFLFHEGVIRHADDVRRVEPTESPNTINVRLSRNRAESLPELLAERRQTTTSSSCGLCGRRTLDSLAVVQTPLNARWVIGRAVIINLPDALRAAQVTFTETGGLHAAGLFDLEGQLQLSAEDVGRHNAVDKLIGRMMMQHRLPLERSMLFVSGRSSFEIVQKAFLAGIPLVAAVSAPSSLAVEFARSAGMTLIGFVRNGRFNIYTRDDRVQR